MFACSLSAVAWPAALVINRNESISTFNILLLSLFGFLLVFIVLIAIMLIIRLIARTAPKPSEKTAAGGAGTSSAAAIDAPLSRAARQPENTAASATGASVQKIRATGSLGAVDLYDVDDKTAALLMAIAADSIGAPLNELRFKSIREIHPKKL